MPYHDAQGSSRNDFVRLNEPPSQIWKGDCAGYIYFPGVGTEDGRTFISAQEGAFAFANDGSTLWGYPSQSYQGKSFLLNNGLALLGGALFSADGIRMDRINGNFAIVRRDGVLVSLSDTGVNFLSVYTGQTVVDVGGSCSQPVEGRDGAIYVVSAKGPGKCKLVRIDGDNQWTSVDIPGFMQSPNILGFCGKDRLYVTCQIVDQPSGFYDVACLDLQGHVLWSYHFQNGYPGALAVAQNGDALIILQDTANQIIRFSPAGAIEWSKSTFTSQFQQTPVVDALGNFYLTNLDRIYCYGPDGNYRWDYSVSPLWGWPIHSPLWLSAAGLSVGADDGFVHSLAVSSDRNTIKINVEFESRVPEAPFPPITYDLRTPGSSQPFAWRRIDPSSDGTYNLILPTGTFDIGLKADRYLSTLITGVVSPGPAINAFCFSGDADNNDSIDLNDLNIVIVGFGGPDGDLDGDNITTISDLNRIFINFRMTGEW